MFGRQKKKKKVLFIGYDRNLAILHGGTLMLFGQYDATAADSTEWGRQIFSKEDFDAIILGPNLSEGQRKLLAEEISQRSPGTTVCMIPEAMLDQLPRFLRSRLLKS